MSLLVGIINGKQPSGGVGGVADKDFLNIANNFLNKGIVGTNDFLVAPSSLMNLTVNAGNIYIPNSDGSILYPVSDSVQETVTVPSNSTGNDRYSTLVIKLNLAATPDNFGGNVASYVWVNGTSGVSPTAPTDSDCQTAVGSSNGFIRLADVYVANGATSISSGNITDKRAGASFKVVFPNYTIDTYGSTITFDISKSKLHLVTLTGNPIFAVSNCPVGQSFMIRITEDGTGGRVPTWFSTINWGNFTPTSSPQANKSYLYGFLCTAPNVFDGCIVNEGI